MWAVIKGEELGGGTKENETHGSVTDNSEKRKNEVRVSWEKGASERIQEMQKRRKMNKEEGDRKCKEIEETLIKKVNMKKLKKKNEWENIER